MQKKKSNGFAQTLRVKAAEALNAARIDEQLLYPIALAVARRQMREFWLSPAVAIPRRHPHHLG